MFVAACFFVFRLFGVSSYLARDYYLSASILHRNTSLQPTEDRFLRVFVFVNFQFYSGFCLVLALVARICYCLFIVSLEFQIIRFGIALFLIEISFLLPPPPPRLPSTISQTRLWKCYRTPRFVFVFLWCLCVYGCVIALILSGYVTFMNRVLSISMVIPCCPISSYSL